MQFPTAIVLAINAVRDETLSAQPNAPVVPYVERSPRGRAIRLLLAKGFASAARAVAPADHQVSVSVQPQHE